MKATALVGEPERVAAAAFRLGAVEKLQQVVALRGKVRSDAAAQAESTELIETFIRTIRDSPASGNEAAQTLLEDLEGQVTEALSRDDWFNRWGRHYLPSLARAHQLQQCNNFKDPGVQGYGGELFAGLRDEADDLFVSLPPPKPSRPAGRAGGAAAAPISMQTYHNCGGG